MSGATGSMCFAFTTTMNPSTVRTLIWEAIDGPGGERLQSVQVAVRKKFPLCYKVILFTPFKRS